MNGKRFVPLIVAVFLIGGSLMVGHAQQAKRPAADAARLEKIIEQNEQILKNQEEVKQALDKLRQDILQLRRRTS